MKHSAVILSALAILAGCSRGGDQQKPSSPEASLIGHIFELKEVDGKAVTVQELGVPSLSFVRDDTASLRVAGRMCNSFTAPATLVGNKLTAKGMVMTKMLCGDDALNALDHDIGAQLEKGTQIEFANGKLTLKGEPHTLVYFLKAGEASAMPSAPDAHTDSH